MIKNAKCGFAAHMRWRCSLNSFAIICALLVAIISIAVLCTVNPAYTLISKKVIPLPPEASQPKHADQKNEKGTPKKAKRQGAENEPISSTMLEYIFEYSAGQNSKVVITPPEFLQPEQCVISGIWVNPVTGEDYRENRKINHFPVQREKSIELAPYLHEGFNKIVLKVQTLDSWNGSFYVHPKLIDGHWASTLACIMFWLSMSVILFCVSRRAGLDIRTSFIIVAGMIYLAQWLINCPGLAYTNDIPGHLAYTYHMAKSIWVNPYEYQGHEEFHPFLYYFFTGRIFYLFRHSPIDPITALRVTSLVFYMVFVLYGLRLLSQAVATRSRLFYISAILITFWPVSILRAVNINNDIPVYAVWTLAFYYLMQWYNTRELSPYRTAVMLVGVLFMIKSNAWVPLGLGGVFTLYGLYTRRITEKQLFAPETLLAFGVLASGIIFNMGRIIYYLVAYNRNRAVDYFGTPRHDYYNLAYMLHLDLRSYLHTPFVTFGNESGYFNFFLKTALYSETGGWGERQKGIFLQIPHLMNITLLCLIAMAAVGVLVSLKKRYQSLDSLFPYLVGTFLSLLASMMFTYFDRYVFCQNFRYVMPMLVPFVILYARGMEALSADRRTLPLYWLGCGFGVLLPVLAVVLFIAQ